MPAAPDRPTRTATGGRPSGTTWPRIIPPLLTADPLPYAAFIARHLVLPVGPRFGIRHAVAETEDAMAGDRWFWSDDNAKVVEFLSLPIVAQAFPEAAEAAFGFLKDLCSAPFIYRRVGQPRLDTVENDGARATFLQGG